VVGLYVAHRVAGSTIVYRLGVINAALLCFKKVAVKTQLCFG